MASRAAAARLERRILRSSNNSACRSPFRHTLEVIGALTPCGGLCWILPVHRALTGYGCGTVMLNNTVSCCVTFATVSLRKF